MNGHFKQERRQHPRIEKQLPLELIANGYDFITTTQNVSCVGAYCHIDKYLPPFTKVAVKMDLPIIAGGESKNCDVECKGVVVRSEDDNKGGFNIALFFNEIANNQQKKVSQYLSQFLSPKSCAPQWAR